MIVKLLTDHHLESLNLKKVAQARLSLFMSKYHIVGNHMSQLNSVQNGILKPLSHWTATVLRQLATDIASGSQSSLETVASDS